MSEHIIKFTVAKKGVEDDTGKTYELALPESVMELIKVIINKLVEPAQ